MSINDPTTTAGLLDAAKAAHAAGVQRHQEATARWGRARANHEATAAQRQQMLDRTANGESITEADLERATIATRAALDTADLHASLRDGAGKVAQELEIALMRATVSHHGARDHVARVVAVEAAAAVDNAIAEVRTKLAAYQDRLADLRELHQESVTHNNHTLPATLTSNAVLAAKHPSEHLKMGAVPTAQVALRIEILANAQTGSLERARIVPSLAQHASGLAPKGPAPASKAA